MVATPADTPVTTPVTGFTVATEGFDEYHGDALFVLPSQLKGVEAPIETSLDPVTVP